MRVALITACYGAYDPIRALPEGHGFDDAVLVTDNRDTVTEGWRVHFEPRDEAPRLAAKRPKMMPWLFTDCDAAVWLDASFEVNTGFGPWARAHLDRDDFVVWIHPEGRIDIRQEADVSMQLAKYQGSRIPEQVASYAADGFPESWGLFACGTIGWRFSPEAKSLGVRWFSEQSKWSIQDQISLPYLLWATGKTFGVWRANEYDNPYVKLRWDQRPEPQK